MVVLFLATFLVDKHIFCVYSFLSCYHLIRLFREVRIPGGKSSCGKKMIRFGVIATMESELCALHFFLITFLIEISPIAFLFDSVPYIIIEWIKRENNIIAIIA